MMVGTQNTLTIAALARNEARHLIRCFKSLEGLTYLPWTDTLIILDSRANEATRRVAREVADRVVVSEFVSFPIQRNKGLDLARGEWVFFIDPDERCSPTLALEIAEALDKAGCSAYRVPRRNILFGHEVRHTGWWPDYQIRLLRRDRCRYDETREVHELPMVNGEVCTLSEPLIHYNYENWRQFISKQRVYARYDAAALHASGRKAGLRNMTGQPLRELKRRLVDYQGYKDGALGFALSVAMALYVAETYRQLWLVQRNGKRQ